MERCVDLASELLQDLKKESKRKQTIIYILIAVIFGMLIVGVVERSMWEYETVVVDSQDGGNANYIGEDGNIINGQSNCTTETSQEQDPDP